MSNSNGNYYHLVSQRSQPVSAPPKLERCSQVLCRLRPGLGTLVAVEAEARLDSIAQQGISAAFEAVARVERLMHPSRIGSDLAALAVTPCGTSLAVHPWTWEVLELCQRLNVLSRGIFDPCLDVSPGRMRDLELAQSYHVVPHSRLTVDLGGVAKGYAVDRALEALRDAGCDGGLVNAGGDLAVFGARGHKIVCRVGGDASAVVELHNSALATSDVASPDRPVEHRGYYHGADRGAVISGNVTVMAASAAVADALTKCLLSGDHSLNQTLLDAFEATQIQT